MSIPTQRRTAVSSNGHSSGSGITIADGAASSGSCSKTTGRSRDSAVRQRRRVRRLRRKKSSPMSATDVLEELSGNQVLQVAIAGAVLVVLTLITVYKMTHPSHHDIHVDDATKRETYGSAFEKPKRKKKRPPAVKRDEEGFFDFLGSKRTNYVSPDSLPDYGDKTNRYSLLREEYDALLPPDPERSSNFVKSLHKRTYKTLHYDQMSYDIYNCPEDPPPKYPQQWNILEVLDHWNPDDANPPPDFSIHQGLCVFDYTKDFEKALRYREMELPFIMKNDPEVYRSAERWNQPGYMAKMLGDVKHRTEYSPDNHFMFWMVPGANRKNKNKNKNRRPLRGPGGKIVPEGWSPPTEMMRMDFKTWLSHANVTDDHLGPDNPHWYYRLIGCGNLGQDCDKGNSEYLYDELTFFQPVEDRLYVVEPDEQKGIHCRFGMKGVIAENHFDNSRNAIVVLGGERRYILAHPNQCTKLALYPKDHPSGRHSAVDWSNPDLKMYPDFAYATANEVVLQAGDVLYLPTFWFHYIVSLELNFQCNQRSGVSEETKGWMTDCGF